MDRTRREAINGSVVRRDSAAADGRSLRKEPARDEPPELRQGGENGPAPAAGDVFVIVGDGGINDRLGGAIRAGEFAGLEISQRGGPR
jgi:hypothetical protein